MDKTTVVNQLTIARDDYITCSTLIGFMYGFPVPSVMPT